MIAAGLLLLFTMGQAVAVPSKKMMFDEVAVGLSIYRREKDDEKRRGWLNRLAPSRDPRVAVALGEALLHAGPAEYVAAYSGLVNYFGSGLDVRAWWKANETDLRRRAKVHPR
jgi:hypothetical protein